jgi:hypothetical protein
VQAQITVTQANAKANAVRARALGTNPNLVTLVQAERWNGVLPTTMVRLGGAVRVDQMMAGIDQGRQPTPEHAGISAKRSFLQSWSPTKPARWS